MKKLLTLTAVLLLAVMVASAAFARPANNGVRPTREFLPGDGTQLQQQVAGKAMTDTTWFGNTHWNGTALRWEANAGLNNRNNRWTFDSGVNGGLEGWWGWDLTKIPAPTRPLPTPDNSDFRWTTDAIYAIYGTVGTDLFPTVSPTDNGAIWCSKYQPEADELCYVSGQGYGNGWGHEAKKTFPYVGTGDVRLTYKYWQNSEKNYDFTYLYLEFNNVREANPRITQTFRVGISGTPPYAISKVTKTLTVAAATIPAGTTSITCVFRFTADSGWSDEDGAGWNTPYGGFCCYNFKYEDLSVGGTIDEDTFEASAEGWVFVQPAGYGHFTAVKDINTLPPAETSCPCVGPVIQGNVLVQYDQNAGPGEAPHPDGQDAMAMSPYMDLQGAGVNAAPIKYVVADAYMSLPLNNSVYYKVWLRQYPVLCATTGLNIEQFKAPDPFITYVPNPSCFNDAVFEDFSTVSPDIQYAYIGLEVLSLCSVSTECTNPINNTTPYWDNVTFMVTGTPGTPAVASTEIRPFLQDIFAIDGTLRPRSTCNLDNSGDTNFGTAGSDARLEDTMYVTAAAAQIEVNLNFRYKKGPGTQTSNVFFTRYPAENTWYTARCDTARSNAQNVLNAWMSRYIESSPYFAGQDQNASDILPDAVFTPGSIIEYYWSADFLANPAAKFYWPNVPGGDQVLEVHLLPGMTVNAPGDTLWPCTLYIQGDNRQPLGVNSIYHQVESGLNVAMGGAPAGPFLFDRYDDVLIGSNTNASFARQDVGNNGMTQLQSLGYRTIVGGYGFSETYTISNEDGSLLRFWLTTTAGNANDNRQVLYFSGDGLAVDMSDILKPVATDLLNNFFGTLLQCNPYNDPGCPVGANADTTFCVQLSPAAGADPGFTFSNSPYRARGNGCPTERRFSVLQPNAGVPSAKQNLDFVDQDASGPKGTTHYESITNDRSGVANGNYRTVFDGVGISRFKRPVTASFDCTRDSLAIIDRFRDVFNWGFAGAGAMPLNCRPTAVTGVDPNDGAAGTPKVNALSVGPNPFNPLVKLQYAVATPGKVTLRIYDVRGALVTTLVDENKVAGRYQAIWQGKDDSGRKLASGVFWAKYSVAGSDITRQLVLLK